MKNDDNNILLIASVAAVGGIIGIGKLLQSGERLTLRLALGRAITTSALAVAAFAVLGWFPDISMEALVGLSVLAASIGEQGLEKLLNKYTKQGADAP